MNQIISSKDGSFVYRIKDRFIKTVIIPEGVTKIGYAALSGFRYLKSVFLPDSLTLIGKDAFQGCTALASIVIPRKVTKIGWNAFKGCTNLESITLSEGLESIGCGVFEGCSSLTTITIPASVQSIGQHAFEHCLPLREIHFLSTNINDVEISRNCFEDIHFARCILYVPYGMEAAYRSHPILGLFKDIVAEPMAKNAVA